MTHAPIHANIVETNGPYYRVKLYALPRVGDRIELTSLHDIETGHSAQAHRLYEVTKVVHKLQDTTDKFPNGSHEIEILVR